MSNRTIYDDRKLIFSMKDGLYVMIAHYRLSSFFFSKNAQTIEKQRLRDPAVVVRATKRILYREPFRKP